MAEIVRDAVDDCVIALYRASREERAETFQNFALERVGQVVPFDFAVWSRAAFENGKVILYSVHELRLPPGAMETWRGLEHRDVLGPMAFAALGKTVKASPGESVTDDPLILEKLIAAFDLRHFLTTCLMDPFTSLISSVTLIRRTASPPFSEAERQHKERCTPHLVESYTASRLLGLLDWRGAEAPYPYAVAICDREGLLEFASSDFVELLRREWPEWTGPRLPPRVLPGETASRHVLRSVTLRCEPAGRSAWLRIRPSEAVDRLSEREAKVARLSAMGRSNKQIGQALSVSPFTVRNHLENVYRKLGISKRGELGALAAELGEPEDKAAMAPPAAKPVGPHGGK